MSPRAAGRRAPRLGFESVHDYVGGKADWIAAGLPTVRAEPGERRALDVVDRDPLTCGPDTRVRDLPRATSAVVLNDDGIVLGRVDAGADADARAEDVMHPGPATVRASEPLEPLLARMADRDVTEILVTTPEGRLLGVVRGVTRQTPRRASR